MDLTPFVDQLRRDLVAAAQSGGEARREAAAGLAAAVDPAIRMMLLDALVAAADELTGAVGTVVEVRLRGREVELVAHAEPEPTEPLPPPPPAPPSAEDAEAGTARVSLRLPEALKTRAERAAAAEGISLNTWLVRAVGRAVEPGVHITATKGRRITGWAQS